MTFLKMKEMLGKLGKVQVTQLGGSGLVVEVVGKDLELKVSVFYADDVELKNVVEFIELEMSLYEIDHINIVV